MNCPQCQQAIDGIATGTYAVGWCRQDIHLACFLLHCRACPPCRAQNAEVLLYQEHQ